MKLIGLIFFGFVITILMPGCKRDKPEPCPPHPDTLYFDIRPELEAFIPYTGFDTLRFMRNNTDLHTFIGQGKQYFYTETTDVITACDPNILRLQGYTILFKGQTINKDLYFSHYIITKSTSQTYISIRFFGKTFERSPDAFGPPYSLDSILIQGKIYRQVYFIPKDDVIDTIYYTQNDGIIKIGFISKDTWEIVK